MNMRATDEDEESRSKPPKNDKSKLLTMLLSSGGDVSVKLITLVLVVVSGGGNLFQTHSIGHEMKHELDRAFRQLRELHDDFVVKRETSDTELARAVRETHEIYQGITESQRQIVNRQQTIIEQQDRLVKELNALETKIERFSKQGTW